MSEERRKQTGFTIIELMVVLVIIGIFAAITAPKLVEVSHRNTLSDLVNMTRDVASTARVYAEQTRRATVLEVSGQYAWVNVLEGSDCWSSIDKRCMHNIGKAATLARTNRFDMKSDEYLRADSYLCGVTYAGFVDGSCQLSTDDISPGDPFALCYSGRGELYIRIGDDATGCSDGPSSVPGVDIVDQDGWIRACAYGPDGEVPFNGALLRFNRFEEQPESCDDSDILDVERSVHVPIGGIPYSKVGI